MVQWTEDFSRVKFTDGMLLCAQDLESQWQYETRKRRLFTGALLGKGKIVTGLSPERDGNHLILSPGLALDGQGREIFVLEQVKADLPELLEEAHPEAGEWQLCLEYMERVAGKKELPVPDPRHPGSAPSRIEEGYRLILRQEPEPDSVCIGVVELAKEGNEWKLISVVPLQQPDKPDRPQSSPGPVSPAENRIVSGELLLDLRQPPSPNGIYYSREIQHGLGPGEVLVTLALRTSGVHGEHLITGDGKLFGLQASWAVQANPVSGTFAAAVSCKNSPAPCLHLLWTAQKIGPVFMPPVKDLELKPAAAHIKPGGRLQFRLFFQGKPWKGHCRFQVEEQEGGIINQEGWYTAPEQEGIYRIEAYWGENFQHCAASYIAVRDKEQE
ncbi:MAG: hypothetical protein HFG18_04795 [Oscillospiraceae bacterium]|nr:hypothetical protein [Oscillospiraceae bacterium]